jgi:hypothetical protein
MADFNPGLNKTSDPNYEGAARPVHVDVEGWGNHQRERNLNIFQGIARGAGAAVQGGYDTIKSGIEDAVYSGVDPIRDAQGVGAAVLDTLDQASQAVGGKPADPELMKDSISKIHTAYQQGKISETNYYAQLETMTRSIRSRFPGFREEVDAMVHSVTGITPANALRSSILHDLSRASESQDALAKEFRSFETNKAQYLPSDYWQRKSAGKPYSEEETRAHVASQEQLEHGVKQQSAALDLKAKQNNLTEGEAESTARDGVSAIHTRVMTQLNPFFQELVDKQKSGKPFTPEEQQFVRARFNQYKAAAQQAYDGYFDSPLTQGSTRTMGGLVKDKRAGIISDQMKIFDTLEKNLFDPQSGVVEMAAQMNKGITDQKTLELTRKYPLLPEIGVLTTKFGPAAGEMLKGIILTNPELNQKVSEPIKQILSGQNISSIQGKTTADQQLDDLTSTAEGKKPATIKAWVDSKVNLLANPALDKESIENVAKSVFGNDPMGSKLLGRFNEASQQEVFQKMVAPQVVANMQKVGGTAWENYSSWAKNAFVTTIRSAASGVGNSPDSPYWKVTFNDKSSRFELSPTPEGIRFLNNKGQMATGYSVIDALSRFVGSDVKSQIDKINLNIDRVKPVLEAGGHNTSEEIKKLTGFMSQYDSKNPNFWQWIMKGAGKTPGVQGKLEDETFGGVHPNFTQASGGNGEPRGLVSLVEDTSLDSGVRTAAKDYYTKGMDILENEGQLPKHIAQGFMANFKVESGFDPEVLSGRKKGDGGSAVGLAQWHPDRQAQFKRYFGKDLVNASYEEQLRFVLHELDHMESGAKEKILKARNAAEAAALVDAFYERSSGEHRSKRVKAAMNYAAED